MVCSPTTVSDSTKSRSCRQTRLQTTTATILVGLEVFASENTFNIDIRYRTSVLESVISSYDDVYETHYSM